MLVNIQGNIIDTEKIYRITSIILEKYYIGSEMEDIEGDIYNEEKDIRKATQISFTIVFFKEKILKISKHIGTFKNEQGFYEELSLEKKEESLLNIKKAYEELISYWNSSKSVIPEIKL